MPAKLVVIPIIIVVGFLYSKLALAADISIDSEISQLSSPDDEFVANINININTADGTQYYLRGVFFVIGTTNYCGYTWSGTDWYKGPITSGEGWKNFLPITINESSWSGQLKAKVDTDDSGCKETGEYIFKVQRYTTSGSGSFDNQPEKKVSVVIPTSTPTPTNTPKPTSTPTNTQTPQSESSVTPRGASQPRSIVKVNTKPTFAISPTRKVTFSTGSSFIGSKSSNILGASALNNEKIDNATKSAINQNNYKIASIALALIGAGFAFLTVAFVYLRIKNRVI
ncbi:hypothetical protein ACFL1A_01435 [Patescibacteria group bacterium]